MVSIDELNKLLEENRPRINKKDYLFFHIDDISALARICLKEADSCVQCAANAEKLKNLALTYPELINSGEPGKRNIEDSLDHVAKHLSAAHGYSKKGWYKPLYSLVGIAIGLVLALLLALVVFAGAPQQKVIFLVALSVPTIAGYIAGGVRDFKNEKSGKIM
ncbi:MAG: hypothetical protein MJZ61_06535 [Bacteroidales bacterium]|nr:hypothetical protein [Bacteroidales bacterium]